MIGLNVTVDVYRPTEAVNEWHEEIETKPGTATASGVAARFTGPPTKDGERLVIEFSGKQVVVTAVVLFHADANVQLGDFLKYDSADYRIVALKDVDEMGHHLETMVVRVQGVT